MKKQWNAVHLFSIVFALKTAGTDTPMKLRTREYRSLDVPTSLWTDAIERDYPLAIPLEVGPVKTEELMKKEFGFADSFDGIAAYNYRLVKGDLEAVTEYGKNVVSQLKQHSGEHIKKPEPEIDLTPEKKTKASHPVKKDESQKGVQPVSKQILESFMKCSKQSIPILKTLMISPLANDAKHFAILSALLESERGNGTHVLPNGMACGAYLGEFGISGLTFEEQAMILTVMTMSYPNPASLQLFTYLMLFKKAKNWKPLKTIPGFWIRTWWRVVHQQLIYSRIRFSIADWVHVFASIENSKFKNTDGKLKSGLIIEYLPEILKQNAILDLSTAEQEIARMDIGVN